MPRATRTAAGCAPATAPSTRLNEAWGTNFWSQRYGGFDEIFPPRKAPYSHNPSSMLDFRRFTSDMLLECYLMEREILLEAGATQPITTNFMGPFKPADYNKWAPFMDVIADDCYPDPTNPDRVRDAAFQRDLDALAEARRAVDPDGAGDGCRELAPREPGQGARGARSPRPRSRSPAGRTASCSSSGASPARAARSSTRRCCRTPAPTRAPGARSPTSAPASGAARASRARAATPAWRSSSTGRTGGRSKSAITPSRSTTSRSRCSGTGRSTRAGSWSTSCRPSASTTATTSRSRPPCTCCATRAPRR